MSSPTQRNGFARAGETENAAAFEPDFEKPSLIKGWFLPGHFGVLAAPPAHGKTAITASLAAYIARGHDLRDMKAERGAVYYLAPEDPTGVKKRAYPHLLEAKPETTPFFVVSTKPDLSNDAHIDGIIDDVRRLKAKAETKMALVVFDTYNRSIGASDENSSSDVAKIVENGQRVETEAGAMSSLYTTHLMVTQQGGVALPRLVPTQMTPSYCANQNRDPKKKPSFLKRRS